MISQYYIKRQYKNADAYLDHNLFYYYLHKYNVICSTLADELWDETTGVVNPSIVFSIKEPLSHFEMISMHDAMIEDQLKIFISAERWG